MLPEHITRELRYLEIYTARKMRNLSSLLALFSWVMGVLTARVPEGIRNFSAFALRYETQTYAYIALLTSKYPNFNVSVNE